MNCSMTVSMADGRDHFAGMLVGDVSHILYITGPVWPAISYIANFNRSKYGHVNNFGEAVLWMLFIILERKIPCYESDDMLR